MLSRDGDYIFIAEEGMGGEYAVGKYGNNVGKDPMNDRITLIMRKGDKIIVMETYTSSVDSTNYLVGKNNQGKYQVLGYEENRKHFATLRPGKYEVETFIRKKDDGSDKILPKSGIKHLAFRFLSYTPTVGENPAHPERGNPGYAEGILYHASISESWNDSEGCQVTREEQYAEIIKMFGERVPIFGSNGKVTGYNWVLSRAVGKRGYYYLINQ